MKKKMKWRLVSGVLVLSLVCGGAALAAGDEKDPLVTLSYLQQTVIPSVVAQVEEKAAARQTQLQQDLASQIDQYKQTASAGGGGSQAGYTLVTLTKGQTMSLEVGCEVLLRIGSLTVNAGTSPALIDLTTGGTINAGASLTQNHLYMSTIADRTLTPTADTVKLLVRGGYTVA